MAYIGNKADVAFTSLLKQDLTGASGTTLTLSHAVANENDIALYINNVRQEPISAYTVNNVTVNLTGTVSGTDDIYVIYLARAVQTTVPPDGSVSTAKIADSAVNLTSKVTGVLPVANGGTGTSTSTDNITTLNSGGVSVTGTNKADFTGLPSGIKRIHVNFYGVSAGSDAGVLIRLGTSGGFVSSGYGSISHYGGGGQSDSSGWFIGYTNGGNSINGIATINHMGSNVFVTSHSVMYNTSNGMFGGGYKDLGATLTQLTVRLVSGGNFDAGLINIMYEL